MHSRVNKNLGLAGRDFVMGFMKRNPHLALRKPESISINRIVGINRNDVNSYFMHLIDIVETNDLQGYQIYNCDEGRKTKRAQTFEIVTSSPYKIKKVKANKICSKSSTSCELSNIELNHSSSKESEDYECFACGELYTTSRPGESWLKCTKRQSWGHELCSSYSGIFVCDICEYH